MSDVCVCTFHVCEVIGFVDWLDRGLIYMWEEFRNAYLLMTWVWLSWGDPVWLTGHSNPVTTTTYPSPSPPHFSSSSIYFGFCLTLNCLSVCPSYNPSVCLSSTLSFSPCVSVCVCAWVCNSFLLLFCRFRVQTILPGQMNIKIGSVNARVHVTEVVDEVRDVSTAETGMRKGLNRLPVHEFVNNWMHKLGWLRNE